MMPKDTISLEEIVRQACKLAGADFNDIADVKLDNYNQPRRAVVSFKHDTETMTIDFARPGEGFRVLQ